MHDRRLGTSDKIISTADRLGIGPQAYRLYVRVEHHITKISVTAVALFEACFSKNGDGPGCGLIFYTVTDETNGSDSSFVQCLDFSRQGDSVLIDVLPNPELVPRRIRCVENVVTVAVVL